MCGLASRPRSHGATSAQPAAPTSRHSSTSASSARFTLRLRDQLDDARAQARRLARAETGVHVTNHALAIDQIRGGHGLDAKAARAVARGVRGLREVGRVLVEEFERVAPLLVEVDAEHREALLAEFALEIVQ